MLMRRAAISRRSSSSAASTSASFGSSGPSESSSSISRSVPQARERAPGSRIPSRRGLKGPRQGPGPGDLPFAESSPRAGGRQGPSQDETRAPAHCDSARQVPRFRPGPQPSPRRGRRCGQVRGMTPRRPRGAPPGRAGVADPWAGIARERGALRMARPNRPLRAESPHGWAEAAPGCRGPARPVLVSHSPGLVSHDRGQERGTGGQRLPGRVEGAPRRRRPALSRRKAESGRGDSPASWAKAGTCRPLAARPRAAAARDRTEFSSRAAPRMPQGPDDNFMLVVGVIKCDISRSR